jgi:hypothetical protein
MGQSGPTYYDVQGNESDTGTGYVVDPTTYGQSFTDINPYSEQAGGNIFGGNVNNYINQALGTSFGAYDTDAAYNNWINNQFGQISDLVSGQQSALQMSLTDRASQLSNQAMNSVASKYAGQNALYGSGFSRDVATAGAQPFADVANMLGSQQINLTGQLAGQQLGLANSNYQFAAQQAAQNALSQQAMASQLLGLQTQFGDQTFVSPDLATEAEDTTAQTAVTAGSGLLGAIILASVL